MSARRGRTTPGTNGGSFAPGVRGESPVDLTEPAPADPYAAPDGLTRQSDGPLVPLVSLATENLIARETARGVAEGIITVDPPYQRGAVWTLDQRINLVRSWIIDLPVPPITVNDRCTRAWAENSGGGVHPLNTGQGLYAVIDGRQRCETARMWFDGEFAVPASWFEPDAVAETVDTDDGPYVTYRGLTDSMRTRFAFRAKLPRQVAKVDSIEEEAKLYLLLNGEGTAQTEADMANAERVARGG